MKTKNLKELLSMDSLALTAVIDFWKEYDKLTVLLAHGELKRREFSIPDRLIKKQNQFCEKNDATSIDDLLNLAIKEIGFDSYEEYFYTEFPERALSEEQKKEIEEKKKKERELKNHSSAINPSNIVAAGRAIKSIVSVILIMIVIAIISILIAATSKDLQTIQRTYVFVGVVSLICNLLILIQLYSAGDNLVKSAR